MFVFGACMTSIHEHMMNIKAAVKQNLAAFISANLNNVANIDILLSSQICRTYHSQEEPTWFLETCFTLSPPLTWCSPFLERAHLALLPNAGRETTKRLLSKWLRKKNLATPKWCERWVAVTVWNPPTPQTTTTHPPYAQGLIKWKHVSTGNNPQETAKVGRWQVQHSAVLHNVYWQGMQLPCIWTPGQESVWPCQAATF